MKFSIKVAAAAALFAMPAVASAQSYNIWVGYADGLRSGGFFPNPWDGDPIVQFFSGYASPAPDAGAIMIQNTGATTLSIDALVYSLAGGGGFSYSFNWAFLAHGGSFLLDPGKSAIFTGQNNSGDFDTSDLNVGSCASPNPNAPHLDATVNTTTSGFNDTGKILDTFGSDLNACPGGPNESIGWTLIGNANPGRGNVFGTPEPSSIVLTSSGLLMLAGFVRRRRTQA